MTMGALLAELPDGQRVLFDLGFGARTIILEELALEFWGGRLLSSLASVGLTPDDIDVVAYSHLHTDHVGWTIDQTSGALTFGRARHVMHRSEWEHWTDEPRIAGPVGARRRRARAARRPRRHRVHDRPGHHDHADARSHSRTLLVSRRVGNGTRGSARRRHPLPAADQLSRMALRGRRQSAGRAVRPRTFAQRSRRARTPSLSVRTSPMRSSAGFSRDPFRARSRSTSRCPRHRSRLAPDAPPGEVVLPALT